MPLPPPTGRAVSVVLLLVVAAGTAHAQPAGGRVVARVDRLLAEADTAVSPEQARARATEALALSRRAGYARGVGRSEYAVAYAAYMAGAPDATVLFADAARSAHQAGDAKTEGFALAWQGTTVAEAGDEPRGRALIRAGLAVHRRQGGDAGHRNALIPLNLLGYRHVETGQPDSARAVYLAIARDAVRLADPQSEVYALLNLADLELGRGQTADAARQYRRARQAAASAGLADLVTDAVLGLAKVDVALGRWDEAARAFRRIADSEQRVQPGYAAAVLVELGTLHRERGWPAAALGAYREAQALVDETVWAGVRYDLTVREAAALFDLGRTAEARATLRPAADSVVALSMGSAETAHALVLLARDARLDGRPGAAVAFARRATGVAAGADLVALTRDGYAELSAALEAAGDARGALAAFRRAAALTDRLRDTEQARRVGRLEAEAEAARDRAAARAERQQARVGLGALAVLLVLGVAGAGAYVRQARRAAREGAARTAEIGRQAAALAAANADLAQTNVVVREARETQARFFQTASHELRTPLMLTLGPLDDLRRGLHGPLGAPAQGAADLAHGNAARLARLVDDLLDAARLDAGHVPHRPAPADLPTLIRATVEAFASHAARGGVALTVQAPEALSAVVDSVAAERALGNLLANALRHTPRGGTVAVRLGAAGGAARVAVADTGPGVDADALPHLFERFYRADESAGVGTGLGLALAREWMERHGGRVEVESAPGAGATFTLVFPLTDAPARRDVAEPGGDGHADPFPGFAGLSALAAAADAVVTPTNGPIDDDDDALVVLVAEDSADLRAYVAAHLGRTGGAGFAQPVRVVEAADGGAALRLAQELVPDLVVSDVMMPEMDGVALTEALKADWRTSHVPVLLLTAKADGPSRVAGFQSGADGYLPKPFDAEVLRAQAAALVAERRRLRDRPPVPAGGGTPVSPSGDSRPGAEPEPPALTPADRHFLDRVDGAIADGLGDSFFGAERLAETLALSPRQLRRKLGAITGDTPAARLRRARVEAGAALLGAGTHTVREAALAVGYADDEGFRRAFVAVRGGLPSEAMPA